MDEEEFVGCISCMSTNDLSDLFAAYADSEETYAKMFETCFDIKVSNDLKYICAVCVENLEKAVAFKEQTTKNIAVFQTIKDEEYLDETILEEADGSNPDNKDGVGKAKSENEDYDMFDDLDDEHAIQSLDDTVCIYCELQLPTAEMVAEHIRSAHEIEPRTGVKLRECSLCGVLMARPADHADRCHGIKSEIEGRKYPCHFCDNVYNSKKACFTHLRMKHGLKLCNDQTPKLTTRERKKCHLCNRDFSQKQILNKHLWKAHGFEVEKRKAFTCPLCCERVSYGAHFSAHLLRAHRVLEQVEELEFYSMDDFMLFKSAIQEETKYRFRKTTASKQTIEGVRSHYMCSQSGVYVYQGKGKRPAPERQIYKTGKACPAHMIVTETMDRVHVTFYKTHVGHGPCPYFEPREPKKPKQESNPEDAAEAWICDTCGMGFLNEDKFREHVAGHQHHSLPCHYCPQDFQDLEAWTHHIRVEHNMASLF
ncbi:hypothetical protein ABMA27_012599 [Loxostege sticticalis]|uniref:Uncharacterized protein n=1 Tax=Loxostege sticticalis TaxID=481309 RepID=A0ABR3GZZ5_LOXSC